MRFQNRDANLLMTIFENDGVLAKRHVKELFWPEKSWRAMEQRLSKLHQTEFIAWPDRVQQRHNPIPEPICWLGWKGALTVAGNLGVDVQPPGSGNENQQRLFQKRLREQGIRWLREPHWSMLAHDMAVIDFRIALEKSLRQLPVYSLEKWLPDGEFRSNMDVIQFSVQTRDGRTIQVKRGMCPDAYFEIVDENLKTSGKPHKARFLLEIDMATHDNPSFGKYKALPGVAYIKSTAYKARFGSNHGIWLVVTSGGERRLGNLIRQTEERVGEDARMFFFATFNEVLSSNVLISPVWHQAGSSQPMPLIKLS